MIVLFEDGSLNASVIGDSFDMRVVDARREVTFCRKQLDDWLSSSGRIVYTNSLLGLETQYHWNDTQNDSDLLLYSKLARRWIPLKECTARELKVGLNYPRLYLAGEFDADKSFL